MSDNTTSIQTTLNMFGFIFVAAPVYEIHAQTRMQTCAGRVNDEFELDQFRLQHFTNFPFGWN
ncbi:MAG TPA: hypothetical protein PKH39_02710 [Woeseiaceae bacterium]|nr:hypothetical protein [Woeseiaceae bacterium]